MGLFKSTRSKIALVIIYSLVVLGMTGYIVAGKAGKHTPSNHQQESQQTTPIISLQSSIPKLPTSSPISIRSGATKIPTTPLPIPCTAKDIKALVNWGNRVMGTQLGVIFYTNVSSSPCSLFGYPKILLKDESGFVYQTEVANYTHLFDRYSSDNPATIVLRPRKDIAQTDFSWQGCVPAPKGGIDVFITLPHDASQFIATIDPKDGFTSFVGTPSCPDNVTPANQSLLNVGSFELFHEQ